MEFINSIKDDELREFLIMKEKQAEESNKLQEFNKINNIINTKSNKLSKISNTIKNNKKEYGKKSGQQNNQDSENTKESYNLINELIKNSSKFTKFTINQLHRLYYFILFEINNKNLYKEYNIFYEKYNTYCSIADDFICRFNFNRQNRYIEYILKNNMKHNKLLNTINYESITKQYLERCVF
jgi:hypothetical protein